MTLAKHDPSAQMPWAKATLLIVDIISSLFDRNTATSHGAPRCCKGAAKERLSQSYWGASGGVQPSELLGGNHTRQGRASKAQAFPYPDLATSLYGPRFPGQRLRVTSDRHRADPCRNVGLDVWIGLPASE